MAEFTAQPLRILDRIYRFTGGLRGLRQFDLAGQIIPVHDLSREAERGVGGMWALSCIQTHAGAGSLQTTIDPYLPSGTLVAANGYQVGDGDRIWVLRAFAQLTVGASANFGGGAVWLNYPPSLTGISDVASTTPADEGVALFSTGTTWDGLTMLSASMPDRGPLYCPPGGTVTFLTSETGGIGITMLCTVMVWKGPAPPPGFM